MTKEPGKSKLSLGKIRPGISLIGAYIVVIFMGALILLAPFCAQNEISLVDALFTSASAITITGLITVDTATTWTPFGKAVILVLIQLGGIGIMSLTTVSFLFASQASLSLEALYFQELAGVEKMTNIKALLGKIVIVTLLIEAAGAIAIFPVYISELPFLDAVGYSIFHAISAFCSAGFTLLPDGYVAHANATYFLGINMGLIILGGLGFLVLVELWERARGQAIRRRFSLHLRVVVMMSTILLVLGTFLLWTSDQTDFITALFHSVTARSAGFNTVDTGAMTLPAVCLLMVLMFIGAGPGSTGGGIKVTSLATLVALGAQRFRGDNTVTLLKRTIPTRLVIRAVAVALIGVSAVVTATFLLVIFQTQAGLATANLLRDALFEAVSAVCTVGLSVGLTGQLTTASKFTVIFAMIIGRLGLLTIAYGLAAKSGLDKIKYAEGEIMIG